MNLNKILGDEWEFSTHMRGCQGKDVTEVHWWHIMKDPLFSEPWISSHKMEILAPYCRPVMRSEDGKDVLFRTVHAPVAYNSFNHKAWGYKWSSLRLLYQKRVHIPVCILSWL